MTTLYAAHVCNGNKCKGVIGSQVMFRARGYDSAFEQFVKSNLSSLTDNDHIHVFRYDFDAHELRNFGYFWRFGNWRADFEEQAA